MNISLFQDTWIENAINLLGTTCKALYSYAVHHSAGGGGCTTRGGGLWHGKLITLGATPMLSCDQWFKYANACRVAV